MKIQITMTPQNKIRGKEMPTISMFFGILVSMYYFDNQRHKKPHIHARYQENEVVVEIPNGEVLEGDFPSGKMKLLQAWIEIHKDDLVANWHLASNGEAVFKIEPLK